MIRGYSNVTVAGVLVLVACCLARGPSPLSGASPGAEQTEFCAEKRVLCAETTCGAFGDDLDRVAFECNDSPGGMLQAVTCICLGVGDTVLSSSSESHARGEGSVAASAASSVSSSSSS
jgi:hypothetical protein